MIQFLGWGFFFFGSEKFRVFEGFDKVGKSVRNLGLPMPLLVWFRKDYFSAVFLRPKRLHFELINVLGRP